MGLSSFNRMRRLRAEAEMVETEKFVQSNALRNAARNDKVRVHSENRKRTGELRALDAEASQKIGEATREGVGNADYVMRSEHMAEIAGRDVHGAQQPKDQMERLRERVMRADVAREAAQELKINPQGGAAVEQAVEEKTGADLDQSEPRAEAVSATHEEVRRRATEAATSDTHITRTRRGR